MAHLNFKLVLRCTLLILCLSILLPSLALAKGYDGEGGLPLGPARTANGGLACYNGFKEMDGCANIPAATDCEGSSTSCWAISDCGNAGQRACCAGDGGPPACFIPQVEVPIDPDDRGLCADYAGGCLCNGNNANNTSSSYCQVATACGGDGQRACCPGEPDRPFAGDFACPNGNGVDLAEVAADPNPAFFCGEGAVAEGILTNSICQAVESCGGVGQRACCSGEREGIAVGGCQADLVEAPGCDGTLSSCMCGGTNLLRDESSGTCVVESSCGGIGERGCCLGDERLSTGACKAGLTEVPNGCTGNCYCGTNSLGNGALSSSTCVSEEPQDFNIAEPSTNCEPGSPGCPLRGYADMHVHMFGHLAHGGATFIGQPYDELGGVNAALGQDAWTTAEIEYAGAPRTLIDKYGSPVPVLNESQCNEMKVLSLGGLTWTGAECQDLSGNRVVTLHGGHGVLYDTIGAGTFDMAGNVDASNIDTPAGPLGLNAPFGAPAFNAWPTWTTTVHQQVYYKWLERAHLGGLRLMVMMAINSEAACRTGNHLDDVDCEISMLPPDRLHELDRYNNRFELKAGEVAVNLPPIELQLQAAYKFETWLNQQPDGGWFKIVRSTEEARQAIAEGKLAVVLSIEVDHLFNCHATNSGPDFPNGDPRPACTEQNVLDGIDKYYDKGVRHIFPVHNFDNAFAGAAAWSNSLNVANRAMEGHWWEVEECPTGIASLDPPDDDGFALKVSLGFIENLLLAIGFPEFGLICDDVISYYQNCSANPSLPCDNPPQGCTTVALTDIPDYAGNGHDTSCNQRGLSPINYTCPEGGQSCQPRSAMTPGLGPFLIDALMDKGMLIDIDHMSIRALNETLDQAESRDYPLLASHVQFFELQKKFNDAGDAGRHERMRTREQLVRMANLGSLVAPVLQTDALRTKATLPYLSTTGMPEISNDCRNSTKSWALTYQYAVDVLGGPVAVGSDWNGVAAHLAPRFGNQGCGGSATTLIGAFDPDDGGVGRSRAEERSAQEKAGNQLQYPFTIPGFGTFDKQVTGQKTFDFNYDGLAHVGMMPDMLGDLLQIGLREQDLNPLLRSAEAYVTLWEKANFIAGSSNDLGPTAPAQCVDRVVTAGLNCTAVDVSIAENSLFANPNISLVQDPPGPYSLGTHQVTLVVNRDNSLTCEVADSCAANVTVSCPPTADAGGPYIVAEGSTVSLDGSANTDPQGGGLTYQWDLDGDDIFEANGPTPVFSAVGLDGPDSVTIKLQISDGSDSATATSTVEITNVAPTIIAVLPNVSGINEGELVTVSGTFSDPALDVETETFSGIAIWSDGVEMVLTVDSDDGTFTTSRIFADDHPSTGTPSDQFAVAIAIDDDDGGSAGMNSPVVTVSNVAPSGLIFSATTIDENGSTLLTGSFADPGTLDTFEMRINWADSQSPNDTQVVSLGSDRTFSFNHQYLDDNPTATTSDDYRIMITVTDDDTGSTSDTGTVTVNNVAPVVAVPLTSPEPSDEGSSVTASARFTDVGTLDTLQCTLDYGDGSGARAATVLNGVCTGATHFYVDNGQYTVTAIVTDDDGGVGSNSSVHQVNNVAPVIGSVTGDMVNENDIATVSGTFSDVGLADSFTVTIDWGEGVPEDFSYAAGSTGFTQTHQYLDDNQTATPADTYDIAVTVTDDDGGFASDSSADVIVNNLAPEVGAIVVDSDLVPIGTEIMANASFTDTGTQDTYAATWDWGDGSAPGTVTQTGTGGLISDPHTYDVPGLYTIELTVTDDDTGNDSVIHQYVVVYDPEGPFVTGGGKIYSPAGAYVPDPSLSGVVNFGFVSKYKKGANVPTGNTKFKFKAAGVDFKSTDFEWLVVAGARAQFKGTGTIEGQSGSNRFFLTVIDGKVNGGDGSDRLRMRIWDAADNTVLIYDNQPNAADDADPTTVIQNGSIVIHRNKDK